MDGDHEGHAGDARPIQAFAIALVVVVAYKQLEGKAVEVDEIQPAKAAYPIIEDALARYSRQRRRGFKGE